MSTTKEWKFRKNVKIIPGIHLKYGKNGITTEFDTASEINIDYEKEKLRQNLFKQYSSNDEIKSQATYKLTSPSLSLFKNVLLDSNHEFNEITHILSRQNDTLAEREQKHYKLSKSLFKFLFKKKIQLLEEDVLQLHEEINELKEQLSYSLISLDIDSEETFSELYKNVYKAFKLLVLSEKKWDLTSSKKTDQFIERTTATSTVTRSTIDISQSKMPLINSDELPIQFNNINGGDLFFFPGFLILHESKTEFAIIDYTELNIEFRLQKFIEDEKVPSDTKTIGHTWFKTNKDGSPDKRFANNYQIPIVEYGELHFTSKTGLNEMYSFSNAETAELFYKAMHDYISTLKDAKNLLASFNS